MKTEIKNKIRISIVDAIENKEKKMRNKQNNMTIYNQMNELIHYELNNKLNNILKKILNRNEMKIQDFINNTQTIIKTLENFYTKHNQTNTAKITAKIEIENSENYITITLKE